MNVVNCFHNQCILSGGRVDGLCCIELQWQDLKLKATAIDITVGCLLQPTFGSDPELRSEGGLGWARHSLRPQTTGEQTWCRNVRLLWYYLQRHGVDNRYVQSLRQETMTYTFLSELSFCYRAPLHIEGTTPMRCKFLRTKTFCDWLMIITTRKASDARKRCYRLTLQNYWKIHEYSAGFADSLPTGLW